MIAFRGGGDRVTDFLQNLQNRWNRHDRCDCSGQCRWLDGAQSVA
jgi:hypothetical protein